MREEDMKHPGRPSLFEFQRRFAADLLTERVAVACVPPIAPGMIVHRSNVSVSLRQAVEAAFPVARALVGDAFFAALADRFVIAEPPRVGWLFAYGVRFPDFVAADGPARSVPYLADVARLERARVHAANTSDTVELNLSALARLAPDALASLRLRLHPAASLIVSHYRIFDIWQAHREADAERSLAFLGEVNFPQAVLVSRPSEMETSVVALDAGDAALLRSVLVGERFNDACQAAIDAEADYDLAGGLARLAALRAICPMAAANRVGSSGAAERTVTVCALAANVALSGRQPADVIHPGYSHDQPQVRYPGVGRRAVRPHQHGGRHFRLGGAQGVRRQDRALLRCQCLHGPVRLQVGRPRLQGHERLQGPRLQGPDRQQMQGGRRLLDCAEVRRVGGRIFVRPLSSEGGARRWRVPRPEEVWMKATTLAPFQGFGPGLRPPHYGDFLDGDPPVDFVEVSDPLCWTGVDWSASRVAGVR